MLGSNMWFRLMRYGCAGGSDQRWAVVGVVAAAAGVVVIRHTSKKIKRVFGGFRAFM